MNKLLTILIMALIAISALFSSCRKEIFTKDPADKLLFSTDTVQFDTIFTGIGSTTKYLIVKNPNKSKSINIDRIYLASGRASKYRLNIDGKSAEKDFVLENCALMPGDSIFIFVEVTINPGTDDMVEQDSIIFESNGNAQDVDLVAFGQNVTLLSGRMITQDTTWNADKPVLIYNSAMVDTLVTLTVMPGTKVYFHNKSSLFVKGTLKSLGEIGNRITFTGDRLEEYYRYTPGQWGAYLQDEVGNTRGVYGGIHLLAGSRYNEFNNTDITNALIGVQVDSVVTADAPTLKMKNTNIENSKIAGLYALGAHIEAENCVFANCAQYTVVCWIGGKYSFKHCTMANYSVGVRQTPQLSLNNYYTYRDANGNTQISYRDLTEAYFANCIIYGYNKKEIGFDFISGADANVLFDNCLIRYDENSELTQSAPSSFIDNIFNEDPMFMSTVKPYLYNILEVSAARDKAKLEISETIPFDHEGTNRMTFDGKPDIGAYEYVPEEPESKFFRRR
jgi:hypothetical protein